MARTSTRARCVAAAIVATGITSAGWCFESAAIGRPSQPSPGPMLEKIVLAEDLPADRNQFAMSADGTRAYFAGGSAYYVFDSQGDLVTRIPVKYGFARTLLPLADGNFISAQNHGLGQIALLGPDGGELRPLVTRNSQPEKLRQDHTGWTSPTGIAFDAVHQLLFALDTTTAPAGVADPDWSRIVVFDADGKYLRQIAAYDGSKAEVNDPHRTWYDDIAVDTRRSLLYVTARASRELWAFDYAGTPRGRVPGVSGIAVLPGGKVAVCDPDSHHIRIYDSALRPIQALDVTAPRGLESDSSGRLYASTADPTVLFLRWPATLSSPDTVRPPMQRIAVSTPPDNSVAGEPFSLSVSQTSRPPLVGNEWHAFSRPSDGSDLTWRELQSTYANGTLEVRPPRALLGLHDVAIRFGAGMIGNADSSRDLHVEKTISFRQMPNGSTVGVRSTTGRAAFLRGETIDLHFELSRGAVHDPPLTLALSRGDSVLLRANVSTSEKYWQLPGDLTRRLLPGHYRLLPTLESSTSSPFEFDLAEAQPSSPMQRILYHEFDQNMRGTYPQPEADVADRLAFVRDYVQSVAGLGFTRETDRSGLTFMNAMNAGTWRQDSGKETSTHDLVPEGGGWEPGYYLDRAVALGVRYDTQILGHCAAAPLAEASLSPLRAGLQRLSQWLGKYPSFYGFNYNDELFFSGGAADQAWLHDAAAKLGGRPLADAYRAGLDHMYAEFDRSVQQVRPDLARTATPMWQFPAVEGSYPPAIYAHMTESYSHYLSEGFSWPFYPAHSAEILRRPSLPLLAVFDNGYATGDGESYLKDALQVLGRGVQGFGTEHMLPLRDASGSDALRTMNELGEAYGPIFAEAAPQNEAAVLYSYTQDVTEKRDVLGTPHWERVLALHGAGLMAGLPMDIVYEEDVTRGSLLDHGTPRVGLLFLVGQSAELPASVMVALRAFSAAGGRVVVDRDSRALPGSVLFPVDLLAPMRAVYGAFDTDVLFPKLQPAYEAIASALSRQFAAKRRFAIDTDDPWVSKNHFDGGAIQYVLVASETSPYPWKAGTVWSLGARYTKSNWPKRVELSLPTAPVVYDVFDRRPVSTVTSANRSKVEVDLRTFPGRLYALAPAVLGPPKLSASVRQDTIDVRIDVGIHARVPLRMALSDARGNTSIFFRGSNLHGELADRLAHPIGQGPFRLEVSELLGGKTSAINIEESMAPQPWLVPLRAVDIEREPQIRSLLSAPSRTVHLLGAFESVPTDLRASLIGALKAKGLTVTSGSASNLAGASEPQLVLAKVDDERAFALIQPANAAGLFGRVLGERYPGRGRGFVSAAFAYRGYAENCVAVVGGDEPGLELAIQRFMALLGDAPSLSSPRQEPQQPKAEVLGSASAILSTPTLDDRVGVRLSAVEASHGRLAVAANGYLGNLARVDDLGDHGQVIAVMRAGESPSGTSLFISRDGNSCGLAARTTQRFGEAFFLHGPNTGASEAFTSFGDSAPFAHTFAASDDANVVLAPGPYGVVAWRRKGAAWREAWAVDYWNKFDSLDWALTTDATRIPSFDAIVPKDGGDVGLIAFGEFTNNGLLSSEVISDVEVSARSLTSGSVRWTFAPPPRGRLLFPKIYTGNRGALVVLQAQEGNSGKALYFALENGHLTGTWRGQSSAVSVAVSDTRKSIATVYGGGARLVELRTADGTVGFSAVWHSQPKSVVFAEDGASVFVSDDAGLLSRINAHGELIWQKRLGCTAALVYDDASLYAAGWDGRLRAFTADGNERWQLDLTTDLAKKTITEPSVHESHVHEPQRRPTAVSAAPRGANLLSSGEATVTVGGTPGWKSAGTVTIDGSALTNGSYDDAATGWIPENELYSDGVAFRKVWAELNFSRPTRIHSLTVRENPTFPESWPTESLIQVWSEASGRWRTVKRGLFLQGSRNTYALDLTGVRKLRYIPWGSYFRNFHTSEIEVR